MNQKEAKLNAKPKQVVEQWVNKSTAEVLSAFDTNTVREWCLMLNCVGLQTEFLCGERLSAFWECTISIQCRVVKGIYRQALICNVQTFFSIRHPPALFPRAFLFSTLTKLND